MKFKEVYNNIDSIKNNPSTEVINTTNNHAPMDSGIGPCVYPKGEGYWIHFLPKGNIVVIYESWKHNPNSNKTYKHPTFSMDDEIPQEYSYIENLAA